MKNKVVMADVARLANVSAQTVSRVIAGHASVRPETRKRVLEAIEILGYSPDPAAQALASGTSRSVGVLVIGELWYGMERIFTALGHAQRDQGRYLLLATAIPDEFSKVVAALRFLLQCKVQAVVIFSQRGDVVERLRPYLAAPTVVVGASNLDLPQVSTIAIGQSQAVYSLVEHLVNQGCRKLVHVAAPLLEFDAKQRQIAFLNACASYQVDSQVVVAEGWGCLDGEKVGKQLARDFNFDAICAANDNLAVGISAALRAVNRVAGQDYALTGFDDIELVAHISPSLSTARQDVETFAQLISEEITRLVAGEAPVNRELAIEVILRESTINYQPLAKTRNSDRD